MKKIFYGIVSKGKLNIDDASKYNILLYTLEGKRVALTIEKEKKQRSLPQNKYYFGVVVPIIAEYLGYSIDETHEGLKAKFLSDKTGQLPQIKSTTDLNTTEWEEYMRWIRIWASEFLGVYIPEPNEVTD